LLGVQQTSNKIKLQIDKMRYKKKLKRAGKAELYLPDEAFLFPFPPPPKKKQRGDGYVASLRAIP